MSIDNGSAFIMGLTLSSPHKSNFIIFYAYITSEHSPTASHSEAISIYGEEIRVQMM
ncbi:MAG: hypothetical protein NVS2B12_16010 [Ktedonobacteraceae bacterium]